MSEISPRLFRPTGSIPFHASTKWWLISRTTWKRSATIIALLERAKYLGRDCANMQAYRDATEREIAAMRTQNMALLARSAQQLAGTANAVSAAKAGYVPSTYSPGVAASPETPPTFVNPRTGAQWSSPTARHGRRRHP
jgi:hypothetical protein